MNFVAEIIPRTGVNFSIDLYGLYKANEKTTFIYAVSTNHWELSDLEENQ